MGGQGFMPSLTGKEKKNSKCIRLPVNNVCAMQLSSLRIVCWQGEPISQTDRSILSIQLSFKQVSSYLPPGLNLNPLIRVVSSE